MNFKDSRKITRREWFQRSGILLGGAAFAGAFSGALVGRAAAFPFPAFPQAGGNTPDKMRAAMGAAPIQAQKLSENLTLLSGPGGNVVVLNGPDGKLMVDTFVLPAWPKLKEHLDGIGKAPLKTVIDTHWHFDHTDNNAHVHEAGATIIAQENTKTRMMQPHDLVPLGLHFDASPANALPDKTFKLTDKLDFAGEHVSLTHVPPAHTDSDIYVHFQNANVIQSGDVFFNGLYPFIDGGGRQRSRHDRRRHKDHRPGGQQNKNRSRTRTSWRQSLAHEIPRYDGHDSRSRSEAEGGGEIPERGSCIETHQGISCGVGHGAIYSRYVH